MRFCPITYTEISDHDGYSKQGLHLLSPALKALKPFPYSAIEQRQEAAARSSKLSVQGIQPKLSANISVSDSIFKLVDQGGRYILKPQVEAYLNLPENEDLSMRLASLVGIETPLHGLIYSKDGTYTYFIRRFDRKGQKQKIHVEDFAQLSDKDRDTKYDSTLEKVAKIIEDFCTFPKSDHLKLFERTLFSFLIGNEDHHLKNFSLIVRDDKVELSPAYDLVNSTLALGNAHEELALPIRGKKSKINREDLVDYFAIERLHLPNAACIATLKKFSSKLPEWEELIHRSFLPQQSKIQYLDLIRERAKRMGLDKFSQS